METTEFHLIVDTPARNTRNVLRSIDEHETLEQLIASAADYEAGEYPGTVVGAFTLTYRNKRLISTAPIADLDSQVHAELRSRPDWRRDCGDEYRSALKADAL